ncbi:MAG TPA: glycosyltransferase family 39 protein [Mycobacteriales bacterium]
MTTTLAAPARRRPAPPVRRPSRAVARLRTGAPLLAILAAQAALTLVLRNSAFQDEALYLYAGHRQLALWLHGAPTYDDYATYFSGAPFFYPVLGALVDQVGGLVAARAVSLLLMLGATGLLAGLTRRLFDRHAGLLAAAAFAVAGPTLFMGGLATYDAPAVFLLALAAWIAVATAGRPVALLWTAAPVLVAAVTIKYAAALWLPAVLGLAVLTAAPRGWLRAIARAVSLLVLTAALAAGVLAVAGRGFVRGLVATTTARPEGTDSVRQVLDESAGYVLLLVLLAMAGAVLLVAAVPRGDRLRAGLTGLLLAGSALLAPAYRAHLHTLTSLQKHAGYGLLFAAPLAGYALARLIGRGARDPRRLGLALAAILLLTTVGGRQAQRDYHDWPDSGPLVSVLRTQVRPVTGHYLVEESEVPRYYLRDLTEPYQWTGTYFFEYTTKQGRRLAGVPAYRAALAERYFDVVALRYGPTAGLDGEIDEVLRKQQGYELIARVPADSSYGNGTYSIWRATPDSVSTRSR